jgi:hypothetical protein
MLPGAAAEKAMSKNTKQLSTETVMLLIREINSIL